MDFQEIVVPLVAAGGPSSIRIASKVIAVDNARETISDGRILGVTLPRSAPASAEEAITLAALVPDLFDFSRLEYDIRRLQHPDIAFGPGTDLTLELTAPAEGVTVVPPRLDRKPEASLLALAAKQPVRTMAGTPPRAADVINVVFVATDAQLNAAFVAAGWTTAVALGVRADTRTILAVAENRGYSRGPVSMQSYQGRPPDHVFQKQTNTFNRRHHVRIWRVSKAIDGRTVWAASATHDIGIKFARAERTFTHRVESNIDLEREKIVNDLRFAAAVDESAYVDRPDVPRTLVNATSDEMTTDGRIAVLVLALGTS
jgi:hypothetical protein